MRLAMRLMAAAMFAAAAAPLARADLTLTLTGTQGGTSTSQTTNYALPPGTGSGTFSFGGLSVTYTVAAPLTTDATGSRQAVTLSATVFGSTTTATDISYVLTGSPFSAPGSTGGAGFLESTLTTTNVPGLPAGTALTATATQVRLNNFTTTSVSDAQVNGGTTSQPVTLGNPYVLQTSGTFSVAPGTILGNGLTFTSTAAVAVVPEPASLVAALAGLPCVGGVLAFARRKLGRTAPAAA
jgi:hypothetical protein